MRTSMLDGFERFDIHDKAPKMRITRGGVTFDRAVCEELGNPQKVYFLVDEKYKRVALQGCDADDEEGIDFWSPENASQEKIHWKTKVLADKLQEMADLDLEHNDYDVPGYLIEDDAMFFDLNTVRTVPHAPQ